jgi:hypothetical protein
MKQIRRRRPLRPRPTRSQVNQQIQLVCSTLQAFQLEWILEAQLPERNLGRLRFLHDAIVQMRDEISSLETLCGNYCRIFRI